MKHLFNEDKHESFTVEALVIDKKASEALRPIIDEAIACGYSIRDIHYIIDMAVLDICLSTLIGWRESQKNE